MDRERLKLVGERLIETWDVLKSFKDTLHAILYGD